MTTPAEKLAKAAFGSAWPFKDVACHNQSIDRVRVALAELCETTNKRYPSVPDNKTSEYARGFLHGWGDALEALQQPYEDEPMPGKNDDSKADCDALSALGALVSKLKSIHRDPKYISVWTHYSNHGCAYDGPKYDKELEAAELVLAKHLPTRGKVMKGLTWAEGYTVLVMKEFRYWRWATGSYDKIVHRFDGQDSFILYDVMNLKIDISTTESFDGEVVTK